MIRKIILAPYYLILKTRHFMFDKGLRKTYSSPVPTICLGNVTVGGTGKTPHTEMLLRLFKEMSPWKDMNVAVLSRGYKRKSKGFQQVTADGTAAEYGDEPIQIKRKFPDVTVAVDKDRIEGCSFLAAPESLASSKKARRCRNKDFKPQDLIILDDAFQYRKLIPSISIVLMDYSRPVYDDCLIPLGRLRDLPERIRKADAIIVTKCPAYLEKEQMAGIASALRLRSYDDTRSTGVTAEGKTQHIFFSRIKYCPLEAVFPEGEPRYTYSHLAVMVTGIANDTPMARYLSDTYKVIHRISFPDHHTFTRSDIKKLEKISRDHPTAVFVTTEKDSQRLLDCKEISGNLRQKMFRIPITVDFLSPEEKGNFVSMLHDRLPE